MGLPPFEYLEPTTAKEACQLLTDMPDEARVYAGGTSLLILMKQGIVRPTHLINIKAIKELRYIREDELYVRIGALATHHDLEVSPLIRSRLPVITETVPQIANIRVRSTGTVGGNLAFAEPLTDLPPIFIALDARVHIEGIEGRRTMPLEDLFAGYYETTLQPNELITEVEVKRPAATFAVSYLRFASGSDKPMVGCAVGLDVDPGSRTCRDARVVLGCVAPTPLRVREAEAVLIYKPLTQDGVDEAASIAARACAPLGDLRGSEAYKRSIVQVLTRRAIPEAFGRSIRAKGMPS